MIEPDDVSRVELARDEITPLVRRILDAPSAEVTEWRVGKLGWLNLMDAELHRVTGTARVDSEMVDWALIMKAFSPPRPDASASDPAGWDYWRREINAYTSGALASLPGGLRAPRVAGVLTQRDGTQLLCLEEIKAIDARPWSDSRFEAGAHRIGAFNAAYLTGVRMPAVDGLGAGGLRSWVELLAEILGERVGETDHGPLATIAVPRTPALAALVADRGSLLDALDRIPQTFVHRDLAPVNFLVSSPDGQDERFVAIDWALAGAGALGEDAAGVVGATLWQLLVDPVHAAELEEGVLRGYLDGLADGGWRGDDTVVRFGYAATLALRFGLLTPAWAPQLDDPTKAEWFGRKFGRPPGGVAEGWGLLHDFVLDRAEEARSLARQLEASGAFEQHLV